MAEDCEYCRPDLDILQEATGDWWLLRGPGGLRLAPRAHVARWTDLSPAGRAALAEGVAAAQTRLGGAAAPAVRFDESGPHLHILIGGAAEAAAPLPPPALLDGPDAALLRHLRPHIDLARTVDGAIAFALRSGVEMLFPHLEELVERGGRLRLLIGDYLGASDPAALRRLLDLPEGAELLVFEAASRAFHPKAWLIAEDHGGGALIVGSSNLSASGLERGGWNGICGCCRGRRRSPPPAPPSRASSPRRRCAPSPMTGSTLTCPAEAPAPRLAAQARLWQDCMREEVPPLFGETFSPGNWQAGIVTLAQRRVMVLLAAIGKTGMSAGAEYDDAFEDPLTFRRHSLTSTKRDGKRGQIISGATPGWTIELFTRPEKLRNGRACPFHQVGPVSFLDWEGDAPITVRWRLGGPVPPQFRGLYGIG